MHTLNKAIQWKSICNSVHRHVVPITVLRTNLMTSPPTIMPTSIWKNSCVATTNSYGKSEGGTKIKLSVSTEAMSQNEDKP